MSKFTTTNGAVGTNGTFLIGTLHKPRNLTQWGATFYAKGTFGGGTLSWLWSDDGTTVALLPLTDYQGVAITSTANDSFNVTFGNGNTLTDNPKFYGTLAGGSSLATVTFGYYDNQG